MLSVLAGNQGATQNSSDNAFAIVPKLPPPGAPIVKGAVPNREALAEYLGIGREALEAYKVAESVDTLVAEARTKGEKFAFIPGCFLERRLVTSAPSWSDSQPSIEQLESNRIGDYHSQLVRDPYLAAIHAEFSARGHQVRLVRSGEDFALAIQV